MGQQPGSPSPHSGAGDERPRRRCAQLVLGQLSVSVWWWRWCPYTFNSGRYREGGLSVLTPPCPCPLPQHSAEPESGERVPCIVEGQLAWESV